MVGLADSVAAFKAEGLAEVHGAVAFHLPFRRGHFLRLIGIPVSVSTVTVISGAVSGMVSIVTNESRYCNRENQ